MFGLRHFPVVERESKDGDSTLYSLSDTTEAPSLQQLLALCQVGPQRGGGFTLFTLLYYRHSCQREKEKI